MYPRLQGSREKVEHWRKAKGQKMLMWQLPTYVIFDSYSLSNILMQEYVLNGFVIGSFWLKVLKLSTKFYNLSLNSYVITAIKMNSKNVGWSSSRLPRLTSSKFLFLPSSKSTKSTTAEFSDFFSSSSPISREFQWKIVAASSILERHSLGLDHSDQPTTLSHSLFIIFLISWNSRCCVFVICCDGKPISRCKFTIWRGARNRSNPKCVKLLRAQDPVIPELLPRWQVLAPMAPAQPRYAGAREGQQGQLRAITSPPLLSHELELGLIFQLQLRSSVKQQASEATWNVKKCPPLLLTNDVSSANENKYQVPHLLLEPVSKINFVARWENPYSRGWCENCWFSDWLSSTWRLQKFGFWHLEFSGC